MARGELVNKVKKAGISDYDGDEMMDDDNFESFDDADIDIESEDDESLPGSGTVAGYKRTWRDTEKYKEMRELYKLINDELYNGFSDNDFMENDY